MPDRGVANDLNEVWYINWAKSNKYTNKNTCNILQMSEL